MKKTLLILTLFSSGLLSAQRYLNEVFNQVNVSSNVHYATNVDFLKNADFSNVAKVGADIQDLKTLAATTQVFPAKYYDPADTNTVVKISDLNMDVYEPAGDTATARPLVIYLHTGNFLPPPINGSPLGLKTDSLAIATCMSLAKRGFVAISMSYRLGWNPAASGPTGAIVRRATLLNAVYRSIHDVKQNVRALKADASGANTYKIDTNQIVLFGEGSGGYAALGYVTLDKVSEMELPKYVYPGTIDSSYVQPSLVGGIDGLGGLLNLYIDNGHSSEVALSINLGGALADESWLEAGDAPIMSFQTVRDPFAPFDVGTVIVPTTNESVVEVHGANVIVPKANGLGNNAGYQNFTYNDPITLAARAKYGNTYQYRQVLQTTITVDANAEGLFPMLLPYKSNLFENEGSPWQWWDANSALAQTVIDPGPPAITAHIASLQSNPNMSVTKGRTYLDTILGYTVPRMVNLFSLPVGLNELALQNKVSLFPNPATDVFTIASLQSSSQLTKAIIMDLNGKELQRTTLYQGQNEVNVQGLPKGVYLVEILGAEGRAVKKLAIQ